MLIDDPSITFDELVSYKLSTKVEFADRILDDLFLAIDDFGSANSKKAKKLLQKWDRKADVNSIGMLLFYHWSKKFSVDDNSTYTKPWNINDPVNTPDGLSDPQKAVKLLDESVIEIEEKFGRLDIKWGDYYRIKYNGIDLPANGIDGRLGVFRVAWPGRSTDKNMYVGGGDSWVSVIEFGQKIRAKALLSYGNSTQKDSPNNGDQLALFSL
jgi:acyl-homoserine-lactone acylase